MAVSPCDPLTRSFGRDLTARMVSLSRSATRTSEHTGEPMASSDRYFPATILGGHLHVRRLPDRGSWNPTKLEWADEEFVDIFVGTDPIHRKARTREELEAVMKEPRGVSPTERSGCTKVSWMKPAACGSRW